MIGRLLLILALLAVAPAAHAQTTSPRPPITSEGTEGFRALLVGKGLRPLGSVDELNAIDPKQVLIVTFRGADAKGHVGLDPLEKLSEAGLDLREFVEKGGALFVATDQQTSDRLKRDFGAMVTGTMVQATEPRHAYLSNSDCPYLVRWSSPVPDLLGPLTSVATNRPSFLQWSPILDDVAIFRKGQVSTSTQLGQLQTAVNLPVAQSRYYSATGGRFLIIADHSIFINSMLLPRNAPNDNLQFASNCIDLLTKHVDGQRRYVLFIEDGKIYQKSDYNLMLQSLPALRAEQVLEYLWKNRDLLTENPDAVEGLVGELENAGTFGELEKLPFEQLISEIAGPSRIVRVLSILGAIVLFGYAVISFMGSKYRFSKRLPRLAMLLDQMRPRAGLIEQRVRSGVGRGLYYELARQRARDMFAELDIKPIEGTPIPNFTVDTSWWQRGRIVRELRSVWTIAFDPEPAPVPGREWEKWLRRLDNLETMLRHGAIRFEA